MSNGIRLTSLLCAIAIIVAAYFVFTGIADGFSALADRFNLTPSDPRAIDWLIRTAFALATLLGVAVFASYVAKCRRALREGTPLTPKEFQQRFGSSRFVPLVLMPTYFQIPLIARGGSLYSALVTAGAFWGVTMVAFLFALFFQRRLRERLVPLEPGEFRLKFTSADRRAGMAMGVTIALAWFGILCAGDNLSRQWVYAGLAILAGGVLFAWSLRTQPNDE
jgi:hypothetical protein